MLSDFLLYGLFRKLKIFNEDNTIIFASTPPNSIVAVTNNSLIFIRLSAILIFTFVKFIISNNIYDIILP